MNTQIDSPFGWWSNTVFAVAFTLFWFTLLLVFHLFPGLDLAAAGRFFDPQLCTATATDRYCHGFAIARDPFWVSVRNFLYDLPTWLAVGTLIWLIVDLVRGKRWANATIRIKTALVLTFALGPGLVVNGLLKPFGGRPRPWMSEDFGGWMPFVPAGDLSSGQCDFNCSFVSGEGSAGGFLICLGILFPSPWRLPVSLALAAIGILMAGLRVPFGAHFLSDAMLGWLITPLIFTLLATFIEKRMGART